MVVELFANPEIPGVSLPIAELAVAITTTPAPGTVESYAVSAAAPPGLRGASGRFRVLVDQEYMIVTAKVDGSSPWDFERGAEGSTPATHAINTPIHHPVTAGALATKADLDSTTGRLLDSQAPAVSLIDDRGSAAGDMLVYDGGTFARLAKGNTDQYLTVRSDGTVGYSTPMAIRGNAWGASPSASSAANSTAIQNAITQAGQNLGVGQGTGYAGSRVDLASGIYNVNAAALMTYGTQLFGVNGRGSTTLRADVTGDFTNGSRTAFPAMVKWNGGDGWAHGVRVVGIRFDTNGVEGLSATWFQGAGEGFYLHDLRCDGTTGTPRSVADAQITNASNTVTFTASTVTEDDVNALVTDRSDGDYTLAGPTIPAWTKIDRINWANSQAIPPQATATSVQLNNNATGAAANSALTIVRPTDAFVIESTAGGSTAGGATGRIGLLNGVNNFGALLRFKDMRGTWVVEELSGDNNLGGNLRVSRAVNAADPAHITVQQLKAENQSYNANYPCAMDPVILLDRCNTVSVSIMGGTAVTVGGRDVVRVDQPTMSDGLGPAITLFGIEGQNWFNVPYTNIIRCPDTGEAIASSPYGAVHHSPIIHWGRRVVLAGGSTLVGSAVTLDLADADASRASLKVPVLRAAQCVATANVASRSGLQTIDGYTLLDGDRVLLTAQTTGSQNGMWVAHTGAWKRPADYPAAGVLTSRSCKVTGGTVYAGSDWTLLSAVSVTIDTDATTWKLTGFRPGDLSVFGAPASASGTAFGDKLALFSSGAGGYGLGVQAGTLVAYVGTGGALGVRAASGSGAASSGAENLRLWPSGIISGPAFDLDLTDQDTARANLKVPVLRHAQCVAVANVAALSGLQTIDGYTLVDADRVLLTAQTTASQNGPWLAHAGAWVRPHDYAAGAVLTSRSLKVSGGSVYAGSDWMLLSTASITVGTDATTWVRVGASLGVANGVATLDANARLTASQHPIQEDRHIPVSALAPPNVITQGTYLLNYDGSAMNTTLAYNNSNAQNDEFRWYLPLSAGTWRLDHAGRKSTDRAIVTWEASFDGGTTWTSIGTLDWYNGSILTATLSLTGLVVPVMTQATIVRARVATRSGLNTTGWIMTFSGFAFTRTA